jgi:two-component system, sensor histidine kinase and response regulator
MLKSPTILIVDDIFENVSTLFHFLDNHNFEVLVARDGESAIELLEEEHPDLILLDVMMPGISGFETCQRLKANANTQEIPIIFMTALSDTVDKVKGFEVGAVDYVTKPFQQEEVLARIKTHLTICKLQKQLQAKNVELEAKNIELETKNAELDAFSHTVAHDLKNPLAHIIAMSDVLQNDFDENLNTQAHQCLQHIFQSSKKMVNIINALLLLAKVSKEDVELTPLNMGEIIHRVQERLIVPLKQYQGKIITPNEWPTALGYVAWVEEIWINYLTNSLKYGGQPPHLEVGATQYDAHKIRFWVRDNGPGLSQDAIAKLFTPFTRLHKIQEGHGLGLSIVRHIVEKLGGEVGVESEIGKGSLFYFTLKANDE